MDAEANRQQSQETSETEWPTAFDETTPADRAGWEEALAGQDEPAVTDQRPEAEGEAVPKRAHPQGAVE